MWHTSMFHPKFWDESPESHCSPPWHTPPGVRQSSPVLRKLLFGLFMALGSSPPACMNDTAITQPLPFTVQMINPIKKETAKTPCHGNVPHERGMYNILLKKLWDEIRRPMNIFLRLFSLSVDCHFRSRLLNLYSADTEIPLY